MQVSEVVEILKQVPNQFLATVRPLTSISKDKPVDVGSVLYSEIKPMSPSAMAPPTTKPPPRIPEILISKEPPTAITSFNTSPAPSLEDVGYYEDEEEGDTPPPIPPRTEDALVILDMASQQHERPASSKGNEREENVAHRVAYFLNFISRPTYPLISCMIWASNLYCKQRVI